MGKNSSLYVSKQGTSKATLKGRNATPLPLLKDVSSSPLQSPSAEVTFLDTYMFYLFPKFLVFLQNFFVLLVNFGHCPSDPPSQIGDSVNFQEVPSSKKNAALR